MHLHHSTTITPARRPVRFHRHPDEGPPFAALPISDEITLEIESGPEARALIILIAQIAAWFDSLEPPVAALEIRGEPAQSPECAVCRSTELTIFQGGQWRCWNTGHCAERAEQRHHLQAVQP